MQSARLAHAQVCQDKPFVFSPKAEAAFSEAAQMDYEATIALHAGRCAEAEATERQSIALCPLSSGVSEEILAAVLDKQASIRKLCKFTEHRQWTARMGRRDSRVFCCPIHNYS